MRWATPTGGDANRNIKLSGTQYSVNNDTLTCFLTDGSTSLLDIAKASYSGPPKLSAAILHSPRFFYVPVLAIQPATGGSQTYSIIDFRAAFITDEKSISTAIKGSKTGTADNGLWTSPSELKIDELKVVFFSDNALPTEGDIPLIDFLGGYRGLFGILDGPWWLLLKVLFFLSLYIVLRATLPRLRYDQLMRLGWRYLLPLALFNVVITAIGIAIYEAVR